MVIVSIDTDTILTFLFTSVSVYANRLDLGLSCEKGQFLPCVYKQLKSCIQLHETDTLLYTPRFELLFLEKFRHICYALKHNILQHSTFYS